MYTSEYRLVQLILGERTIKEKVKIEEDCRDVADFQEAIMKTFPKVLQEYDPAELKIYEPDTDVDHLDSLNEIEITTPISELNKQGYYIVKVDQVPIYSARGGSESISFPPYDLSNYEISFPFFVPNGESYLKLLDRDQVVKNINESISLGRSIAQKYIPIIISTSRGMGKTFLLKMIGLQKVKPKLKNGLIQDAGLCGRILSFDFAKNSDAIQSVEDAQSFFPRLMIYFLCLLFDGKQVDSINFEKCRFEEIRNHQGKQTKFNEWLYRVWKTDCDGVIDEYIRLTNIAFDIHPNTDCYNTPPVFLLDEVQILETRIVSRLSSFGERKVHTLLSFLLTELAGKHRPICICTGTHNGNILKITEISAIMPKVLSLTPLVNQYWKYWELMTNHLNEGSQNTVQLNTDEELLINCLVYASYQIPRLLLLAHIVWFEERKTNIVTNREHFIQRFEKIAIQYYREMATVWTNYNYEQLTHIILCCSVHFQVKEMDDYVPGTNIKWSSLVAQSLIFPHLDDCYLFPFTLVWSGNSNSEQVKQTKNNVEKRCKELVGNLRINNLFVSFDTICQYSLYDLGIYYEKFFVSSLAVKYYVLKVATRSDTKLISFPTLYDFGGAESEDSAKLLNDVALDISKGIHYPGKEAFVTTRIKGCIIHNVNHHNAHHDILLPTSIGVIPVSVKASFDFTPQKMVDQWLVKPNGTKNMKQLIWLYLGSWEKDKRHPKIAFLNGSGVCNGLVLDMLILVKGLKSQNQATINF